MWLRLTSLLKEKQAEAIVFFLGKQKHPIKEKIMTSIGEEIKNNEQGLEKLLEFLRTIYTADEMADAFLKYVTFAKRVRRKDEKLQEFISDWENLYAKVQKKGCTLSDMALAFKLLQSSKLSDIETNLVLTGVNFSTGKQTKNMLGHVKESLKKFIGRSTITEDKKESVIKSEETYVTKEELALAVKQIKNQKKRGRTRSKSEGDGEQVEKKNTNYKGRKNPLGADFKPLKCFKCKCDCVENCQHPCVYHLADKCTKKKSEDVRGKPDLGLFMQHNTESTFFVKSVKTGNDRELPFFIPFEPFTASTLESETVPEADRKEETVLVSEDMENYTLVANNDLISENRCTHS